MNILKEENHKELKELAWLWFTGELEATPKSIRNANPDPEYHLIYIPFVRIKRSKNEADNKRSYFTTLTKEASITFMRIVNEIKWEHKVAMKEGLEAVREYKNQAVCA